MSDGVRIPSFGEHGYGDNTANGAAKLAVLSNGVHYFTKQLLVSDAVCFPLIASALCNFATETVNLIRSHTAEICIESISCLKLFTVD